MNAGTDLDCGTYYQNHLPGAYSQGLLNETTLDQALVRLYSSLVRTGYFDGPSGLYRNLTFADVNTQYAQQLARKAAAEGIVLLKNDGLLPLKLSNSTSIALIGDWANATTQMQGNYQGVAPYLHSPLYAAQQLGVRVNYAQGPGGQGDPTTDAWLPIWDAAKNSDLILYVGGIDISVEAEGMDRVSIAWTGAQLDVIGQLALYGKPMAVVQMGGGQIDSSPIANNPNISALVWGGIPGQDGGSAIFDILTGQTAPAGRLPTTQYPAHYIRDIPMTDMSLRPSATSPGRTYKWYEGIPTFPFGHGLHYTNFSVSVDSSHSSKNYSISSLLGNCTEFYLDRCPFKSFQVSVKNSGSVASDYVTLGFLTGTFGPQPYPKKSLVKYQRLHNVQPGSSVPATLNLTLGSLGRVDDSGNTVLYPGDYALLIDNEPLAMINFTISGSPRILDEWPQPPVSRQQPGDYFVGGYEGYGGYNAEENLH